MNSNPLIKHAVNEQSDIEREELYSRPLGNNYARDEFKRHKKCNPAEAAVFLSEWTLYAVNLARQLGLRGPRTAKRLGEPLGEEQLNHMTDEQIQQLYELHQAAKNPSTSPEP